MLATSNRRNAGGRGGRGSNGRFGQRNQNRNSNSSSTSKKKDEKKLKKFCPQTRGKTNEYSFEDVKKELVKALESTTLDKAEDIIDSVRKMDLIDLNSIRPVLTLSQEQDEAVREAENERIRDTHKYDMKKWDSRVEALANNKRKLHAKVLKFCNEAMEEKLERESDFDKLLYDDPIELLKRIRKFMTASEETDWEYFELWEALKRLVTCHQGGTESPNAFRKKLEEHAKQVQSLLGDSFMHEFAKGTKGYAVMKDDAERTKYQENAWEMLLASGMMFNCDRGRYQSRVDKMNSDFMVVHMPYEQRMTYPVTLHNATETLNRHKPDNKKSKFNNRNNGNKPGGNSSNNRNNGNDRNESGTNLAQSATRACFVCGSTNHVAPDCPHKLRPKSQWKRPDKYKDYSMLQTESGQDRSDDDNTRNRSMMQTDSAGDGANERAMIRFGGPAGNSGSNSQQRTRGYNNSQWSFMQLSNWKRPPDELKDADDDSYIQVHRRQYLKNGSEHDQYFEYGIHLDSGSTFHLRSTLDDIEDGTRVFMKDTFNYGSNIGNRDITMEGESKTFPGSMKKIDLEAKTSVESLSQMVEEGYNVLFDSTKMNAFVVRKDGKRWVFPERDGLYTYDPLENHNGIYEWCDSVAHKMIFNQERRVDLLKELYEIEPDEHCKQLLGRESELLEMIHRDTVEHDNPSEDVADMVDRFRFGRSQRRQEELVGGRVTEANMHKVLERMYGGVPKTYRGGIADIFDHSSLSEEHRAMAKYGTPSEYDVGEPPFDTMKLRDPFQIMDDIEEEMKKHREERLAKSRDFLDNDSMSTTGYCAMQTVEKNKEGFTKKQVERANRARSGYHAVGAPDLKAFKLAVRSGLFKNCPIEEKDIVVAEKIYGPSASVLKGKTKRPTPNAIVDDWIEIPRELTMENEEIDLCIDLIFINNVVALTGVDKQIKCRHFVPLANRTKKSLYSGIDEIFRDYNFANFTVKRIFCDQEFKPIFDEVKDSINVHMNYTSKGEHEPTAERNNQHIKSGFRTMFHRMPYKAVPKLMTKRMGRRVCETSNYYPAKGGISKYYSPRMIVYRRKVDFANECVAEMGAYVQGYGHETHRNQRTRTVDAIYLGPAPNAQAGHLLMDLNTGKQVTRNKVKVLPITRQVIDIVEGMARDEGVLQLRTYSRRNGAVILDADLLAGVDPDDLWDEDYDPAEDTPPKHSDDNLRSEKISAEEVDGLLEDAEDMTETQSTEESDDEHEDEMITRLMQRIRKKKQDEDDSDDEEYVQPQNPEDDVTFDERDAEQALEDLARELSDLEKEERSVEFEFIRNDEEGKESDDEDDEDPEMPELIVRSVGQHHDDDSDSDDEDDDDDNDSVKGDEPPNQTTVFTPRKTRSGRSYWQSWYDIDGTKMRPPFRGESKKLKFSAYIDRKKKKAIAKKNRNAMRRKRKKKRLQAQMLYQLKCMQQARRERPRTRKEQSLYNKNLERTHNLFFQQIGNERKDEYAPDKAALIAQVMQQIKDRVHGLDGVNFIQQFYITKGLKKFKDKGRAAAMKELKQLIERNCWDPIAVSELTPSEKKKAVDAMMLLAEKNDGTIKGRCVFKGNETRDWLTAEDTASPTASHEGICASCVIDAHEERDIMSIDVPNAFIQTRMPTPTDGEDRVTMKITGLLVDYMIELDPTCRNYVVRENGRRVIYVVILQAIYGMLEASLLWYKKLRADLEEHGFVFNPYDPCIANKMVNGKQQTIRFHVDDLMSSHVDSKVNDRFYTWINKKYGEFKEVTCTRGKKHTYLGMTLDFTKKKKVKIRMDDYVERMLAEFPVKFKEGDKQETPAGTNLLDVGKGPLLDPKRKEIYHSFVAKSLFLSKRARVDIAPTVAILASRVQKPNVSDWKKLVRMMRYLHATKGWHLTMGADDLRVIKWHIDASFAVHPDFKSHTGAVMTMGSGAMQTLSRKQKLNSRSSTEAELIGVDDAITQVLWTKMFMEAQGYPIERNILYQDNKSAILLETNGRSSAGKRSRAISVRYFFVTDQVARGNVIIEHMPSDSLWGDFMTKPLQGEKFRKFRDLIMGEQD